MTNTKPIEINIEFALVACRLLRKADNEGKPQAAELLVDALERALDRAKYLQKSVTHQPPRAKPETTTLLQESEPS